MATLLTNCSVVDGVSDTARPDTSVLVDDGRIQGVVEIHLLINVAQVRHFEVLGFLQGDGVDNQAV